MVLSRLQRGLLDKHMESPAFATCRRNLADICKSDPNCDAHPAREVVRTHLHEHADLMCHLGLPEGDVTEELIEEVVGIMVAAWSAHCVWEDFENGYSSPPRGESVKVIPKMEEEEGKPDPDVLAPPSARPIHPTSESDPAILEGMQALEEQNWDWSKAELADTPKTKHDKLLQFQVAVSGVSISRKTGKGTRLLKWIYGRCIYPLVKLLLFKPLRLIRAKLLILVPLFVICGPTIWVRFWLPLCPYISMANRWLWETLTTILGNSLDAWWILAFGSSLDLTSTSQTFPSSSVGSVVSITQTLTPSSSLVTTIMSATSASSSLVKIATTSDTFRKDLGPNTAPPFQHKLDGPTVPRSISTHQTATARTTTISTAPHLSRWFRQEMIEIIIGFLCFGGVFIVVAVLRSYFLQKKKAEEGSTASPSTASPSTASPSTASQSTVYQQLTNTITTRMNMIDGWVERGFN